MKIIIYMTTVDWITNPKRKDQVLIPENCECEFIGKESLFRVFVDVIKLGWGYTGIYITSS